MRIGILFNAPEALTEVEREERLGAAGDLETVEAVESSLLELGHAAERLPLGDDPARLVSRLASLQPAIVFNLCESFRRESLPQMNIPALLELLGLPYTGSGPLALGLSTDKALSKAALSGLNVPVPRFLVATEPNTELPGDLSFPLIVKPLYEDGSYGITNDSVVDSAAGLAKRIDYIYERYQQPSIVEEFIDGREINAAILGNSPPTVLPLSEIEFRSFPDSIHRICSFEAKWVSDSFEFQNTVAVCPAMVPDDVGRKVEEIALRSYRALGCRDYARIDIRLDKDYRPYVLEANANPAISPDAGYVRSLRHSGRTYSEFVAALLDFALHR